MVKYCFFLKENTKTALQKEEENEPMGAKIFEKTTEKEKQKIVNKITRSQQDLF